MREDRPSTTAERAALLRAAHQLLDDPKVLDDPVVLRLIGPEREAALRADPASFEKPELRRLRASIAMRSRYAEDCLGDALRRGVRQYVILGAGLDSFAYRNPFAAGELRVYEVDHPQTQAWKRRRLEEAGIEAPESVAFVPVDFETEKLDRALIGAGFEPSQAAFVSWLGVTVYLTREAALGTLAYVASLGRGSEIVFGYVPALASLGERARSVIAAMAERARANGEPWRTFFEPDELVGELRRLGFSDIEDFGPEQAFERYFRGRSDGLRPGSAAHLVKALRQ